MFRFKIWRALHQLGVERRAAKVAKALSNRVTHNRKQALERLRVRATSPDPENPTIPSTAITAIIAIIATAATPTALAVPTAPATLSSTSPTPLTTRGMQQTGKPHARSGPQGRRTTTTGSGQQAGLTGAATRRFEST